MNSVTRAKKYSEIIKNGLFYNHPVLVNGLALAPALVASTSLKNSLALSVCIFIVSMVPIMLSSLIIKYIPKWLRVMSYCLIAASCYIPAYLLIINYYPEAYFNLGVFLPLIVVSSFIYTKSEKYSKRLSFVEALLDGLSSNLGFAIFICVFGAFREIVGQNKIFGYSINIGFKFDGILLPFAGFIIAGFIAAFVKYIYNKQKQKRIPLNLLYGEEVAENE